MLSYYIKNYNIYNKLYEYVKFEDEYLYTGYTFYYIFK